MRIFTDTLSEYDLHSAMFDAGPEIPSVNLDINKSGKGRRRAMTHEVSLSGYGARHTRRKNTGRYGAGDSYDAAATWMDWGWFIACMFRHEPTAIIGQYESRDDFHETTAKDMTYRLEYAGDRSALNFQRDNAAIWTPGTSPFLLVDRLCPPVHLVNLRDRPVVEAFLAS